MADALELCVSSLRSTNSLLGSSISILDEGVHDFPRLARVLHTARHFELLPESSLRNAQSQLLSTLTPELDSLLNRISTHIDKMARREQALAARTEQLEGRIGQERHNSSVSLGTASSSTNIPTTTTALSGQSSVGIKVEGSKDALKLKQLRAKKERLSYTVERLTLQSQQRERQLRMSVAAT